MCLSRTEIYINISGPSDVCEEHLHVPDVGYECANPTWRSQFTSLWMAPQRKEVILYNDSANCRRETQKPPFFWCHLKFGQKATFLSQGELHFPFIIIRQIFSILEEAIFISQLVLTANQGAAG